MRIARICVHAYRLALRRPLPTAHGVLRVREGAWVVLHGGDGQIGWGESAPLPACGSETLAESTAALGKLSRALRGGAGEACRDRCAQVERLAPGAPAARAAFDTALRDLDARRRGLSLAAALSALGQPRSSLAVSQLVGEEDPDAAAGAASRLVAQGYGTLKLKLGLQSWDREHARLRAVREAVGPTVKLRLDANGAFEERAMLERLEALADLAPEFVEQPVAAHDLGAMVRVRAAASFPIAADEAVRDEASALRVLQAGAADLLALKPSWLGGAGPTLRVARRAAEAGAGVCIHSALETSIGRTACLHVAAALDLEAAVGWAADWLRDDLDAGPTPQHGCLPLPAGAGLGVAPGAALRRACEGEAAG